MKRGVSFGTPRFAYVPSDCRQYTDYQNFTKKIIKCIFAQVLIKF